MIRSRSKAGHQRRRGGFAALLLGVACAGPIAAQAQEETTPGIEMNSGNCGFTFFTEGDDRIDFRGSATGNCFDMLGGNDMLVLNRDDYPEGITAYTGLGRDVVWATDGDDHVIDLGGEDREIRTYGGDDQIDIILPVDEDPFRGFESTERTEIRPGSGRNTVRIGTDIYSDAFARVSPNAWYWAAPGAVDDVSLVCGRPQDPETFDLRVMEVPETAKMAIQSNGCGLGLFGQFGELSVDQIGARFALRTEGAKFRAKAGDELPLLTGNIRAGTGAFIDLTASDPASNLSWEGRDEVVVRSGIDGVESGGTYSAISRRDVLFEGVPGPAAMDWRFGSQSGVELTLTAQGDKTAEHFTLAAPYVDIRWIFDGGFAFPEIDTRSEMPARITRVEPQVIEFYEGTLAEKAQAMFNRAMGLSPKVEGGEGRLNADLPSDISPLEIEEKDLVLASRTVALSMTLRRRGDPDGACLNVRLLDADGILPPLEGRCADAGAEIRVLSTLQASGYEVIELTGDRQSVAIEMNGESAFRVDRLTIRY